MLLDELNDIKKIRLQKDKPKILDVEFEAAWKLVEKNCQKSLRDLRSTQTLLYRGILNFYQSIDSRSLTKPKAGKSKIIIGKSREDRLAIDTTSYGVTNEEAAICDLYLRVAGFSALRGNSLFCNSSQQLASSWGPVFAIFPLNDSEYTFSLRFSGCAACGYHYSEKAREALNGGPLIKPRATPEQFVPKLSNLISFSENKPEEFKTIAEQFVKDNQLMNTHIELALHQEKDIWFRGKFIGFGGKYFENIENKLAQLQVV